MENILVLINLSTGAERIAKLAYNVAKQMNANLMLCNTVEVPAAQEYAFAEYVNSRWNYGDKPYLTIEDLAEDVKQACCNLKNTQHQPQVNCLLGYGFNSDNIKSVIAKNKVKMIVTGIPDLLDLKTADLLTTIKKATCPVLVIPNGINFEVLNTTAYLTDLRYCDLQVVSFLKDMNAKIFVTHVSSSGIPDMDDAYAQTLLVDTITSKIQYNKLFLRNVKGLYRKKHLETVTAMERIQFFTIVNRKHYLLDRFLSDSAVNRRNYHGLPLLIMPYLNWHK